MKNEYESPIFEYMKVEFLSNVLGDSQPPPEKPGQGDIDQPPAENEDF